MLQPPGLFDKYHWLDSCAGFSEWDLNIYWKSYRIYFLMNFASWAEMPASSVT
jgi:hypothetical protein